MARGIRRPAPSPLLLVPAGPVTRGTPKHKLPSIPVPSFQPAAQLPKRMTHTQLPPLVVDASSMPQITSPASQYSSSSRSSSESERGWPWNLSFYKTHSASSSTSSLSSVSSSISENRERLRAPWDYSAPVQFDMESLLAMPKPVAISP